MIVSGARSAPAATQSSSGQSPGLNTHRLGSSGTGISGELVRARPSSCQHMLRHMGISKKAAVTAGTKIGPKLTAGYIRTLLDQSIDGIGPIRPAEVSADARLVDAGGDVEKAVQSLVRLHTTMAGVQGFATNVGGIAVFAVSVPANLVGLTVIHCHLVATIAHARGYDVNDPRVRNAILACMLGDDTVTSLIKRKKLPSSPMALATSPVHDPRLDNLIATEVTTELFGRMAGRRAATFAARRIPLLGGGVGAATDARATFQIGTYAAQELKDRHRIS